MTIEEEIREKITTYPWDVVEGKVVAGKLIKLACKRFIDMLHNDDYYFDVDAVLKVVNFCEKFKHFSGKHNGLPFKLLPWQMFCCAAVYGIKRKSDNLRVTTEVYISIARKNGKSAFIAAAFGLYGLIADGENEAQVILAANSFQQSQILYKFCNLYLKSLGVKADKYFKRYRDSIKFDKTASILKCVAADASKLDGYGPSMALIDEFHEAKDDSVLQVLTSGQAAREQPINLVITTAGFNRFGPCYELETRDIEILHGVRKADNVFPLIFHLDDDDDWNDENVWIKANPSLGMTVKKEFISEQVNKANGDAALEVAVKTKNLNMWCDSAVVWIPSDVILKNTKKVNLKDYADGEHFAYIGLDLASVDDLTAISVLIPTSDEDFVFKNYAFIPEEQLKKSANREKYRHWINAGMLEKTPGNVTDYDYIFDRIVSISQLLPISIIGYDQWNSTSMITKLTDEGFNCEPFSQSIGSMNRPTKEFKRKILSNKITLDNNEVTRWCINNVVLFTDINENEKLKKDSNDAKIDIPVAMVMALGVYLTSTHYDNTIG